MSIRNPINALVALLVLTAITGSALGQDQRQRDTGRHQPAPEPTQEEPEQEAEEGRARPRAADWYLVFGAGLSGGSDLFRAETVNGFPVRWPGSTFQSPDVYTKMDTGLALTVGLGRRLGSLVSVKADFTWSDLDVSGESSVGQVGDVYTYDSFGIWEIALGAEIRLVHQPSAPYLGLAASYVGISPSREDDLAQEYLAGRLALGYEHMMNETLSLRLEGRVSYGGFTTEGYVPTTQPETEVVVDGEDALTLWQLVLGVQMEL